MNQQECKGCMCLIDDGPQWLCGSPEIIDDLPERDRIIDNMDWCPEEANNPVKHLHCYFCETDKAEEWTKFARRGYPERACQKCKHLIKTAFARKGERSR